MASVYQAASMGEATIRVCIVPDRDKADLLVYRVNSYGLALGDALWYVTRSKEGATSAVYFTSQNLAQLTIYFVNSRNEAGWQRAHRMKGKL